MLEELKQHVYKMNMIIIKKRGIFRFSVEYYTYK